MSDSTSPPRADGSSEPDVTDVILRDHRWFRDQFVALYDLHPGDGEEPDVDALSRIWDPLAARLDVHAIAEERIFYPELLDKGEDPEDETVDAIGDHNEIRDGVHDAGRHPVGAQAWWDAVGATREANDEHMAEEEREGIANFRVHAPASLRRSLGIALQTFLDEHPTASGLDTSDQDPDDYVERVEAELHPGDDTDAAGSLGIGSLKGR